MLSLALVTFISRTIVSSIILVCYSIYAIKNKGFLASI